MIKKISTRNIISYYVVFFPFFHLFLEITPLSGLINKFTLAFSLFLIAFLQFKESIQDKAKLLWGDVTLFFLIISSVVVSGFSIVFNLDFYGLLLLMASYMVYTDDGVLDEIKEKIYSYRNILLVLIGIFVVISFYYYKFRNGYDAEGYIRGAFSMPHVLAYYCLIFYAMAYIIVKKANVLCNTTICWTIVKGIAIGLCLLTAVRSALLALFILMVVDFWRMKNKNLQVALPLVGIVLFLYILFFTDILTKIPVVQKTLESLAAGSITNNRGRFAENLFNYFATVDTWKKLLGISIAKIREIMFAYENIAIHAHNDFINILIGYGYINLALYIICLLNLGRKKIGVIGIAFLGILMYFNGLFMYTGFVQSIPYIIVFFATTGKVKEK